MRPAGSVAGFWPSGEGTASFRGPVDDASSMLRSVQLLFHDLDADAVPELELSEILDSDEQARSHRFRNPLHGRRYRVGRARLRQLLGLITATPPGMIRFRLGPNGRPELAQGPVFNVAHSDRWMLVGTCDEGRLGVDLEAIGPIDDLEELAGHCFSLSERSAIQALPCADRSAAFLRVWTRKEAFIKALGGGLSIPLDAFAVDVHETDDDTLLTVGDAVDAAAFRVGDWAAWQIRSVTVPAPVSAAIALDTPLCRLEMGLCIDYLHERTTRQ